MEIKNTGQAIFEGLECPSCGRAIQTLIGHKMTYNPVAGQKTRFFQSCECGHSSELTVLKTVGKKWELLMAPKKHINSRDWAIPGPHYSYSWSDREAVPYCEKCGGCNILLGTVLKTLDIFEYPVDNVGSHLLECGDCQKTTTVVVKNWPHDTFFCEEEDDF